jgi:hypothetical protein
MLLLVLSWLPAWDSFHSCNSSWVGSALPLTNSPLQAQAMLIWYQPVLKPM